LDGIDIALYYAVRGPQSLADVRIYYSPGPTPNIEFLNIVMENRNTLQVATTGAFRLQSIFIPVTRRVKGYTRFVGKYVKGRRMRFPPHKVYIFLIRITSRINLAMSSVRINTEISDTIRATILGLCMQIPEIPAQRKFVSAMFHAHSNAHKSPKTVAPTIFMLE